MRLTAQLKNLLETIRGAGFSAYVVGGAVRDFLLARQPSDFDVATSATPNEIISLFKKTVPTGIAFGTVTVILEGESFEVTTFRFDGEYEDFRRPSSVCFGSDLKTDLARRDFTICAMALLDEKSTDGEFEIFDPFGGRGDLECRIVRAVGNAQQRFSEDALRILRALRFASVLDFSLEEQTERAAFALRESLSQVSGERVSTELFKLLCGAGAARIILTYHSILDVVLPGLSALSGLFMHNPSHAYDVLKHTALAVQNSPTDPVLRLTMLLHDIGKPYCYGLDASGCGHFYEHDEVGEKLCVPLLARLCLPKKVCREILYLVREHGFRFCTDETALTHFLQRHGEYLAKRLLLVRAADVIALRPEMEGARECVLSAIDIIDQIIASGRPYKLSQLAISGAELAFLPPEKIGATLDKLLNEVIDGAVPNVKDALISRAGELA